MKRVSLFSVAVLALAACKAESSKAPPAQNPEAAPVPSATATPAQPAPGRTVRVQMAQQGSVYKFDPANFTVHPGDAVEFVNVSGFPHNVMFDASKVPAGAVAVLNQNMARRSGNLMGPMMSAANEKYTVSFANAPAGTYAYSCLPHTALGMKGVITVAARH